MTALLKVRALHPDEVRIVSKGTSECGTTLLLYKDARVDMSILDEVFGPFGWKVSYSRDNANCVISVMDQETHEWVSKEGVGFVEPGTMEEAKALASDSLKRAGILWGIGRELYTAPRIHLTADKVKIDAKKDEAGIFHFRCQDFFSVSRWEVSEEKRIIALEVVNQRGEVVFTNYPAEEAAVEAAPEAVERKVETPVTPIAPAHTPTAPTPASPATEAKAEAPAAKEEAPAPAMTADELEIAVAKAKAVKSPIRSHKGASFGDLLESDPQALGGALAWILTSGLSADVKSAASILLKRYYGK